MSPSAIVDFENYMFIQNFKSKGRVASSLVTVAPSFLPRASTSLTYWSNLLRNTLIDSGSAHSSVGCDTVTDTCVTPEVPAPCDEAFQLIFPVFCAVIRSERCRCVLQRHNASDHFSDIPAAEERKQSCVDDSEGRAVARSVYQVEHSLCP